jgi:hypothetical protein
MLNSNQDGLLWYRKHKIVKCVAWTSWKVKTLTGLVALIAVNTQGSSGGAAVKHQKKPLAVNLENTNRGEMKKMTASI